MSAPTTTTRRFEVTYTRGDTLATETAVLDAIATTRLGCGCERISFNRPGGQLVDEKDGSQTAVMSATTGVCGYPHAGICKEVAPA